MPQDCFALSGLDRLRCIHAPGRCPGLVCSSPLGYHTWLLPCVPLLGTSSAEANVAPGKAVFESWP